MAYSSTQLGQTEHLSRLTQADILDASEETYGRLAVIYNRDIAVAHRDGLCDPASRLVVRLLGEKGHEAARVPRSMPVLHFYVDLAAEVQGDERVLVDPTWQQFLEEDTLDPEMPKVLIGVRDEIVAAAQSHGVPDRFLDLYLPWDTMTDYEYDCPPGMVR